MIAALLLAAPIAAAESVQGGFTTTGPVSFGSGTNATAAQLNAFVASDLTLGASLAFADPGAVYACLVTYHELGADARVQKLYVGQPGDPSMKCEWLHNVSLIASPSRDDEHAGYIGCYPIRMSATIQGDAGITATPDLAARLASRTAQNAAKGDPQLDPFYSLAVSGAQLVVEAPARETITGSGMMKIRGMDVHATSWEGPRDFTTGANVTVSGETTTWLLLNFTSAQATIDTGAPVAFAVDGLQATTPSGVSFHAITGSLTAPDATYRSPTNENDRISGDFALSLTPNADATGKLAMQGEISAYNLQRVPIPLSPLQAALPWWIWPLGLVAVGIVTGGTLAVVVLRRRVPPAPDARPRPATGTVWAWSVPSDAAPLAAIEAEERVANVSHDWRAALACATLREKRAPHDPLVHASKAHYLAKLGDVEAAIGAYEVAIHLGDDSARLEIALLLALQGNKADALLNLKLLLDNAPELVEEVVREPVFYRVFALDAEYEALVRDAFQRLRAEA